MKNQLNRALIEELNESNNQQYLYDVNDFINNLMSAVVEDVSIKSPFIRADKCVLLPVNEIINGAFTQLSEFDYFLGVENPQIELNSRSKKNFFKYAWREFKAAWRLGRKKYRNNKKVKQLSMETVEKYKITDFRHDVFRKCAEFLSETSIISENSKCVSMFGNEDFGTGVKVNIYICTYDSHKNTFQLFNEAKNKFIEIDFASRFINLENKNKVCGDSYSDMIKIFNAIFSKSFNKVPNQILMESLIYNCPNLLFDNDDVYKTFVNVANYIRLENPRNLVSICDASKNIFDEPLITKTGTQVQFSQIINMLDAFKF